MTARDLFQRVRRGVQSKGVRKRGSAPNGPTDALLSLYSNVERQLSGVLVRPDDAAPVPPSHDDRSR